MNLIKDFFMVLLKPIFWLIKLTKFGIGIKNYFTQKAVWTKILDKCNLLVAAWEDPEGKDTTPDFVEDERVRALRKQIASAQSRGSNLLKPADFTEPEIIVGAAGITKSSKKRHIGCM
jgi:hypothetical protein